MRLVYCLLSPTFGMHQYTADLANRMAEVHDVHLVTSSGVPRDRYSPAVQIHAPATLNNTGRSIESLKIQRLSRFHQVLKGLDPEIVHFTGPHLWNPILIHLLKKKGVIVVHTLHDLEPHTGTPLRLLLKVWNKLVIRISSRIVVHGKAYRDQLIKSRISASRVIFLPLLHLFLSYGRLQELNNKLGAIRYDENILFFGRIESYKGVDTLIDAFRKFNMASSRTNGAEFKLIIAGKGEVPGRPHSELEGYIELIDKHIDEDEAEQLFRNCSIVVLPYHDATQSAVIGAAYFFSKPVVVTACGALPEYVLDGRTGLVVPPGDVDALVNAFTRLLEGGENLRSMGMEGRNWYDEQRILESHNLSKLYESSQATA